MPVEANLAVAIGTAGGDVRALQAVLAGLTTTHPLAVVVIAPNSVVAATDLDGASMPVVTAHDGIEIEAGRIHLVPADCEAEVRDGQLHLRPLGRDCAPIDRCFKSIATAYGASSACVVLSGPGADGARGLKSIKEAGGLTIAQAPSEAGSDGMPRAAIATGLVDLVLHARDIGARVGPTDETALEDEGSSRERNRESLREILTLVRIRSGHDFAHYKRATLLRRVARRMQISESETLAVYLRHLREDPDEIRGLLRDFMISVTSFFRDADAFAALERSVLPGLFTVTEPPRQVRIWVPGCATGEEAYSMAILCAEAAARMHVPASVQIFATDIDQEALDRARLGRYPSTIRADVSDERLDRFFDEEPDGSLRVKKEIRERVLFSPHNVLRDPPFSKLDVVSCRNLLIYLDREAQDRVLSVVHFGLRANGRLFLGSSEAAETASMLFSPFDATHRIFARRSVAAPAAFARSFATTGWPVPSLPTPPIGTDRSSSFGDLHHRLVEQYAAPSLLVNDDLDVVHVSERAGRYLTMIGGEPSRNLIRLIHESLRLDVRAVIHGARHAPGTSHRRTISLTLEGEVCVVTLVARAVDLPQPANRMLLLMFEERPVTGDIALAPTLGADAIGIEPVVHQLEEELHDARDQLRTTIEQYETLVEELKASNQELHAINEELRSASEELETGRVELQSVNEELKTVNGELEAKIDELSRANGDLQNLMSSTEIGVVFLDRSLRIQRFTPRAQDVFNVIPSDIGRPLAHITHGLDVDLTVDAATVLRDL